MKNRMRISLEVLTVGLLVLCITLTALMASWDLRVLWILIPLILLVGLGLWLGARTIRKAIADHILSVSTEDSRLIAGLAELSLPVVLLSGKTVMWYNESFRECLLNKEDQLLQPVSQALPGLELQKCEQPEGQNLEKDGRLYTIHASKPIGRQQMTTLYLIEDTQLKKEAAEYQATRPSYLIIELDGYRELASDLRDSEKARLMENVNRTLEDYFAKTTGFLTRVSTTRYIAVVEERHMKEIITARFDILDQIREQDEPVGVTLSIGVGRGGKTLAECKEMARQSLDMALGRGGDQAAVKTPDGFEFYGGVSHSVEKHSKVKSRIMASALCDLIRQSDSVVIMGHRMSDLDAMGSALGILRICKGLDAPAVIAVRRDATLAGSLLDYCAEQGMSEDFVEPEDLERFITPNTLLVVVDTHIVHLLESREIFEKCRNVVVIDHHRKAVGHIADPVLFYHEPYASSASELVSELLQYVETPAAKPTPLEAEALLAGIMLDTRNFALHTGVRTFEAAAYLRRMGAKTENVKRLFNSSMQEYTVKSNLVENADIYLGCAISVSGELPRGTDVAVPQAANDLLTISGVGASFVAVQKGNSVSISARSMGEVNVQVIMEMLGGGGHLTMAGAQLANTKPEEAEARLREAVACYRKEQNGEAVR